MTSVREGGMREAVRYGAWMNEPIARLLGKPEKSIARVAPFLQQQRLLRHVATIDRAFVYAPTALAARKFGVDERRFLRPPRLQALGERLTLLGFCAQTNYQLLTRLELERMFPEVLGCERINHGRYVIDWNAGQPALTYVVVDYSPAGPRDQRRFQRSAKRVARNYRAEWEERKKHQPFRDLMFFQPEPLFRAIAVTSSVAKARAIRRFMTINSFRPDIVVVPELGRIILREIDR